MIHPHPDAPLGVASAVPVFDDDAWEDLLNYIEEKRVIPIVGPELLRVDTATGPRLLYDWLAEKLAARLSIDVAALPQPYTLNDVVCWFLAARGRREEAYTRLRTILRETTFAPPTALRQLAQIHDFDLFITTTFDPLLEHAINAERFAGAATTEVIAYSPNRVADLTVEREQQQRPVLYHLLGRLSASPTYVISDEDTLEFVCALQSEHLTPEKLFHELEHNHLLLIGSNFSNWLARLFLRMAKRRRLSDPRDVGEIVADSQSLQDRLWNEAGELLRQAKSQSGTIVRFDVSRDGRYVASLSDDNTAQIWEFGPLRTVCMIPIDSSASIRVEFSWDGSRIVTPWRAGGRVWDVRSGMPITEGVEHDDVLTVLYGPNGRFISTSSPASAPNSVQRLWSVPPRTPGLPTPEWLLTLATIAAGQRLNEDGEFVAVTEDFARLDEVRRQIDALPDSDPLAEWARWIVSTSPDRPVAPGFKISHAEAKKLRDELVAPAETAAAASQAP